MFIVWGKLLSHLGDIVKIIYKMTPAKYFEQIIKWKLKMTLKYVHTICAVSCQIKHSIIGCENPESGSILLHGSGVEAVDLEIIICAARY